MNFTLQNYSYDYFYHLNKQYIVSYRKMKKSTNIASEYSAIISIKMTKDEEHALLSIYSAIQTKNIHFFEDVLRDNINLITHKNHLGENLLHSAVKQNFEKLIDMLIQNGLHVDSADNCNRTALHFAVTSRNVGLVECLLKHNASTKLKNIYGKSPLHLAVNHGDRRIIQLLLMSGADVTDCTLNNRQTSLHIALRNEDEATFKLLLNCYRGDLDVKDAYGETFLHNLARQKSLNLAEVLVNRGADVNVCNEDNETALHLAIHHRNFDMCKLLVRCRANVNVKNKYGESPLHLAVRCKDLKLVELFLNFHVDVNQCANDGGTILHVAVDYYCSDILELLVRSGVEVEAKNVQGLTAFHVAVKIRNMDAVWQLLQWNVDVNSVAFGKFIPKGEPQNFTPLHTAIVQKDLVSVKLLLENGAVLSKDDGEIFLAVEFGCVGIVDLLLQCGANINAKKLMYTAMKSRDRNKVELLLTRGADLKSIDETGGEEEESVLHLAVKARDEKFVKFVLDVGVDVNLCDKNGMTALCFAGGKIANLILAKLALIRVNRWFVCERNENVMKEFGCYLVECENELERIKSTRFGDVSLMEFLRNDVRFWGKCVRKSVFDERIDEDKFPIYWEKISCNVDRGLMRWNLMRKVRDTLCEIACFQPLYDVLDDIVDNFSDDELRDFVRRLEQES